MDLLPKDIVHMGLDRLQWQQEEMLHLLGMIHGFEEVLEHEEGLHGISKRFAEIVISESRFEDCTIFIRDRKSVSLVPVVSFGLEDLLEGGHSDEGRSSFHDSLLKASADRAFSTQQPVYLEGVPESDGASMTAVSRPVGLACFPLLDLGVLCLSTDHPFPFSIPFKRNWEILSRLMGHLLKGAYRQAEEERDQERLPVSSDLPSENEEAGEASGTGPNDLFQRAFFSAPQGSCLLDSEGKVLQINKTLEKLHGPNVSELKGRSPAVIFQDSSIFLKLFQKMQTSDQEELADVSLINGEGKPYLADVYLVRLPETHGGVAGFLLVVNDVTKKKAFAEKILQTEKLVAMGTMAGGVAHDFNNLLMAVLGHIQLLLLDITDDELRRRLQQIERAVHDASHTVRRLQKFTEHDREPRGAVSAVDVKEALQDVIELTRPRWKNGMEKFGHTIKIDGELEENCVAAIHASDLREILTNLVLNAVEAMPDGGKITLRCRSLKESIVLEVADTGIGMSKDVAGKIFDPYYTTKGIGNSGLGLSVSWSLVLRAGGDIQVKSRPGRGTVFSITLPRGVTSNSPSSASKTSGEGRSYHVLVVDDEEEILGILRDMIQLKGHRVTALNDGKKALELLGEQEFDLILTDLGMPDISGWEIARQAKARNAEVPVILITGWGAQYEDEDLTERGVDLVLSKPFSWDRLLEAMAKMLPY
jgi:PAS domain S-box-containing protein